MVLTLAWILLVAALGYYLPGRLATLLLLEDEIPEERFVVSFATGFLLVNVAALFITGLRGLWEPYYMTRWLVLGVSAAWTLGLGVLVIWRRRGRLRALVARPTRRQWALWGLTAATTLLFAVNYHRAPISEDDCVIRAAAAVVVNYAQPELLAIPGEPLTQYQESALSAFDPMTNNFLAHNQAQRLGPTVMVAPALALFGPLGLRLVYLLQGLLLPGLGLVLGLRFLSGRWAPWMVAVLLSMSPYAMNIHQLDENFLSSIYGSLMLVLLLRPRPSWALAGAALSLFLGIRHVGILLVPAVLTYVALAAPSRGRALGAFLGALLLASLPYLILHGMLLLHSGALFEGAMDRPPAMHSFFGLEFELSVLLNFPFTETLYRSPYTAFPTLIAFPLEFIVRHGLLLTGLLLPGVLCLRGLPLPRRILLVGWVAPLWALLMIQSNWVEPNKMGVPASVLAPVILVMAAGAEWLMDPKRSRRRRLVVAVTGLLIPAALLLGLREVRTEMDPRIYPHNPEYLEEFFGQHAVIWNEETPTYLENERARFRLTVLPDLVPDPLRGGHARRLLADLLRELAAPGFSEWEVQPSEYARLALLGRRHHIGPLTLARQLVQGELNSNWLAFRTGSDRSGETETFDAILDLSTAPTIAGDLLSEGVRGGGPFLDLSAPGWEVVRGVVVPFALEPVTLIAGRSGDGLVSLFVTPAGLEDVRLDLPGLRMREQHPEVVRGARVRLRLPRNGPLLLVDYRSLSPEREYQRFGVIEEGVVELGPPRAY